MQASAFLHPINHALSIAPVWIAFFVVSVRAGLRRVDSGCDFGLVPVWIWFWLRDWFRREVMNWWSWSRLGKEGFCVRGFVDGVVVGVYVRDVSWCWVGMGC